METVIDKNVSFVKSEIDGEIMYSIFLGGMNDSGITVNGSSKEEVIDNLKSYLLDSLDELD